MLVVELLSLIYCTQYDLSRDTDYDVYLDYYYVRATCTLTHKLGMRAGRSY